MAMGQPTIAYDTAVHREYLAEHGVYSPVGEYRGLADAIQGLIHDPERRRCLGKALRERAAERYSWEQAGNEIGTLYETLIAAKGRKSG
jgi:glycosyltransferase involved in cell wall biosynthesis